MTLPKTFVFVASLMMTLPSLSRESETLGRGLVAARDAKGRVFVSWRLLSEDGENASFNVYRVVNGKPTRVNQEALHGATSLLDSDGGDEYFVRLVQGDEEGVSSRRVKVWATDYLEIPLQTPEGYRPGDCSVGDLDGDGEFELVLHQVSGGKDNSFSGITGTPVLEAYEFDGTLLWRIDLGINIREGEHYTQFMVYDLDGDGCAEIACKTADGTTDGKGEVIGDATKDWRNKEKGTMRYGRILEGPEFFTVFDGRDGKELATVDFIPSRDPINGWGGIGGNGKTDSYGNRCDRFLGCVAYLDGERPSVVMSRGVYGRTVLAAWDWRDGKLSSRWVFDSGVSYPPFKGASPYSGMGGHALSVGDVDGDGRDEVVYQGMTVDDDGKGLYTTGRRHGDALHLGDFDVERPGLELLLVTENENETVRFGTPGVGLHDARTGKLLWSHSPGIDVSSAMAADIDPRYPGAEMWGGPGGLRTAKGEEIGKRPTISDWAIWWDGDLLRELFGGNGVYKWNWETGREERIYQAESGSGRYSRSRRRPNLAADLLGDWREELLLMAPEGDALRLYTTTIPTEHRLTCLLQDPQYRMSVVWQNVSYNKPPHPSRFIGVESKRGSAN